MPSNVYTYVVGMKYPMPGIAGGGRGAPNCLTLRYGSDDPLVVAHTADWVPMAAGDRKRIQTPGGECSAATVRAQSLRSGP